MPKSIKKRKEKKEKNKDSLYFRIKGILKKREIHDSKEYKNILELGNYKKIPHTCTSWSKCMTCISLRSSFLTYQNMRCKYASISYLPKNSTKKPLVVGWKERQYQAFGEEHTHLSDRVNHSRNLLLFYKTLKTSRKKVDQGMND